MSFNKPIECEFSFQRFTKRSTGNPDGWGIALYPGGGRAIQVLKEPLKAGFSIQDLYILLLEITQKPTPEQDTPNRG